MVFREVYFGNDKVEKKKLLFFKHRFGFKHEYGILFIIREFILFLNFPINRQLPNFSSLNFTSPIVFKI